MSQPKILIATLYCTAKAYALKAFAKSVETFRSEGNYDVLVVLDDCSVQQFLESSPEVADIKGMTVLTGYTDKDPEFINGIERIAWMRDVACAHAQKKKYDYIYFHDFDMLCLPDSSVNLHEMAGDFIGSGVYALRGATEVIPLCCDVQGAKLWGINFAIDEAEACGAAAMMIPVPLTKKVKFFLNEDDGMSEDFRFCLKSGLPVKVFNGHVPSHLDGDGTGIKCTVLEPAHCAVWTGCPRSVYTVNCGVMVQGVAFEIPPNRNTSDYPMGTVTGDLRLVRFDRLNPQQVESLLTEV